MVEAEKGLFGEMFDGEQEQTTEAYSIGDNDDGVISFKINCLE